jgi:hypothetical protein
MHARSENLHDGARSAPEICAIFRDWLSGFPIFRPVENHKVNAELIFAAIHAKSFDSESDIQVQVRAWIFHFDCFFDSD